MTSPERLRYPFSFGSTGTTENVEPTSEAHGRLSEIPLRGVPRRGRRRRHRGVAHEAPAYVCGGFPGDHGTTRQQGHRLAIDALRQEHFRPIARSDDGDHRLAARADDGDLVDRGEVDESDR